MLVNKIHFQPKMDFCLQDIVNHENRVLQTEVQ